MTEQNHDFDPLYAPIPADQQALLQIIGDAGKAARALAAFALNYPVRARQGQQANVEAWGRPSTSNNW